MYELIEGEYVIFWQLIMIIDFEDPGINKYLCTVFIKVRQNLGHSFIQVNLWSPGMIKHFCVFLHHSFEHSSISDIWCQLSFISPSVQHSDFLPTEKI